MRVEIRGNDTQGFWRIEEFHECGVYWRRLGRRIGEDPSRLVMNLEATSTESPQESIRRLTSGARFDTTFGNLLGELIEARQTRRFAHRYPGSSEHDYLPRALSSNQIWGKTYLSDPHIQPCRPFVERIPHSPSNGDGSPPDLPRFRESAASCRTTALRDTGHTWDDR